MLHSMNTYSRIPVAFTRGERVWVWDESGKKYLDALAGIAVNTLGHGHPKLTRAIAEQSSRLIHTSNLYRIAEQERLADKRSEEHTSELQSLAYLVCRLLLEKKKM